MPGYQSKKGVTDDFTWCKKPYQLAIHATCPKCGHHSDIVNGVPSGPHCKGLCQKCGGYIKFLGKNDLKLRETGEDKNPGSRHACTVAVASKVDGLCEVGEILFVEGSSLEQSFQKACRMSEKFGYKGRGISVDVDRIPGAFEKDQSIKSKKVQA